MPPAPASGGARCAVAAEPGATPAAPPAVTVGQRLLEGLFFALQYFGSNIDFALLPAEPHSVGVPFLIPFFFAIDRRFGFDGLELALDARHAEAAALGLHQTTGLEFLDRSQD